MSIAFIIQARMGSSRLPEKVLKPFHKHKSILELLIEKLSKFEGVQIILATSVSQENDVLAEFCTQQGITCFRGDENDVIRRFVDAAEAHAVEAFIRICADNPFLDLPALRTLMAKASNSHADYIGFWVNGSPAIKTHFGFWAEYTTLAALKKVQRLTDDRLYHEHVTNYIYAQPDIFKLEWIPGPVCLQGRDNIRLTIDTMQDFVNAQQVYADLCLGDQDPSIAEVVAYLDRHPAIYNTMAQQINQNSK